MLLIVKGEDLLFPIKRPIGAQPFQCSFFHRMIALRCWDKIFKSQIDQTFFSVILKNKKMFFVVLQHLAKILCYVFFPFFVEISVQTPLRIVWSLVVNSLLLLRIVFEDSNSTFLQLQIIKITVRRFFCLINISWVPRK